MNQLKYIAVVAFLGIAGVSEMKAQIKEEQLILDRKREPEVKKIEKKKTSVAQEKNYPPESKQKEDSLNLKYDIVNVPPIPDFKTTEIQGEDISPKFNTEYQGNYFRLGYGNYGKFLGDANVSGKLQENLEIGVDAHFVATTGLPDDYNWSSKQSRANVNGYANLYTEQGKYNVDLGFANHNFNYYGIYAIQPISTDLDLNQKVNKFSMNAYYDHYSNEILNNVKIKSYFLSDYYSSKETYANVEANFSKHDYPVKGDIFANGDLGIGIETVNSTFDILTKNGNNQLNFTLSPRIKFYKGESYLMIGSDFSFMNSKITNQNISNSESKFFWFPKAEILFAADNGLKFYGGVEGGLHLNTYDELMVQNPFLISNLVLIPTETKYHFYAGIRGDIGQLVKYNANIGFSKINNAQFFINNNLIDADIAATRKGYDYANTFSAIYDHAKLMEIKADAQIFPMENLVIDVGLHFANHNLETLEEAYYKPSVQVNIGAKYSMLEKKLSLGFKAYLLGDKKTNSYADQTDYNTFPTAYDFKENKSDKVSGYADLNLSAEYKIHKNFSIFALGNNLLNTKYENFVGYKVLGAQVLAGVKITF